MTTEGLLEYLVNSAIQCNISTTVDQEVINNILQKNNISIESLVGSLCLMALKYNQDLNKEKDQKEIYIKRLEAANRTIKQLEISQNLSKYQVKNLKQRNGNPVAKKFNMNKFQMCIEMGESKSNIMKSLDISESTYYRLLRAYKNKIGQ